MSEEFGEHIRLIAQDFVYPPMKVRKDDIRFPYQGKLLGRVAIAIVLVAFMGFAVPDIRARVIEILRIGAVTITLDGVTESGEVLRLEDVYGETTLAEAQSNVSFDILTVEDNLPDRVYLQDSDLVIFLWIEGDEIRQVLYQIADDNWAIIKDVDSVTQTEVNQQSAYWVTIQHPVQFNNGEIEWTYFVQGNVLVWTDGAVTYRLETQDDMESARAFAESLE